MTDETAEVEVPELETEQPEQTGDETEAPASPPEVEEDEVMVTIGEEAPPPEEHAQAPEWVRELRKQHRQLQREKRELEEKLKTVSQPAERPITVGKKPTLEEYDYDAEKYESELAAWFERKAKADEAQARARRAELDAQQAWQQKLDSYGKARGELKVRDFEDAEATVSETLNVTQQGVLLQGAENPALLVYALGKNPSKAKELASIQDPVKFAFAVAKLETQLKVQNRKAATPPEKTVRGTGPVSGAVDSTLERLRADAERTGDFSKVMAYKRQQKAKR
jgi:hypothetical protein